VVSIRSQFADGLLIEIENILCRLALNNGKEKQRINIGRKEIYEDFEIPEN